MASTHKLHLITCDSIPGKSLCDTVSNHCTPFLGLNQDNRNLCKLCKERIKEWLKTIGYFKRS